MPQGYSQPPRVTRHKTLTRLRRVAQSNKPPGGGSAPFTQKLFQGEFSDWVVSPNTAPTDPAGVFRVVLGVREDAVNTALGQSVNQVNAGIKDHCGYICIEDNVGVKKWCVTNEGMKFQYVANAVVNTNVTLNTDALGEWICTDTTGGPITLTMPTFSPIEAGSWLGLYDCGGDAKCNTVTLDPDNANTGYTLNGETGPLTVIDTDYGGLFLLNDYTDTGSFWLMKWPGFEDPGAWGTVVTVSANHTMSRPERTVLADTTNTNITVTLDSAKFYKDKAVNVKKISAANKLFIETAAPAELIDGISNTITFDLNFENLCIESDGDDWWIL